MNFQVSFDPFNDEDVKELGRLTAIVKFVNGKGAQSILTENDAATLKGLVTQSSNLVQMAGQIDTDQPGQSPSNQSKK